MKPALRIQIVKLTPRRLGDEAEITVHIDAVSEGAVISRESRKITVATRMLAEMGVVGEGSLPFELTSEGFDTLEYNGRLWEAVKKGLDILDFGDNTKRRLEQKLRTRGFDATLSAEAADYLEQNGFIDEGRLIERAVQNLAGAKKYGPARIKNELIRSGFSREIIDEKLGELLEEADFGENLREMVEKKFDFDRMTDRKYRESFLASMYRRGFSPSDTMQVIRSLSQEQENL